MCVCVCVCVCMLVAQSRLTLCEPTDCGSPGFSYYGILQARILEWVSIPFFRGSSRTQGSNPGLSHFRQILYHLSHQGSPHKNVCVCVCVCVCVYVSHSVLSDSMQPHGLWPTRLLCPWDSPGKNSGVDCHFLLQGIFPTQGSNPCLPHWQVDSLPLSHQGLSAI